MKLRILSLSLMTLLLFNCSSDDDSVGETTDNEVVDGESIDGDGMPDDGMPDDGMPDDGMPDDGMPDDGMPDDGMPDDGMPDDGMIVELITYEDVAPIFAANCVECHGPTRQASGVRLDSFEEASGRASRIIARMTDERSPMPPSGQLDQETIDVVAQWIEDDLLEN